VSDSAIFAADFQNEGTCYVSAVRLPLLVPASPVSLAGRLAAVQAAGSGPAAERHQALEWAGGTGFPVPRTPRSRSAALRARSSLGWRRPAPHSPTAQRVLARCSPAFIAAKASCNSPAGALVRGRCLPNLSIETDDEQGP